MLAFMEMAGTIPNAYGQDILIVRPLNNSSTVAKEQEITFEVNVSSFAPIIEVRINGEPQPINPSPTVSVRKLMRLERGFNTILVEVATEFESASKEFEIRFGKPPVKEPKHFQLVIILGQDSVSNPLKASDSASEVSGTRSFLVLVPRYDWFPSKSDTLRLQMIASRDSYAEEALADEEVAFTQLTLSWILGFSKTDFLTLGMGYNSIYTGFDSLSQGMTRQAYDSFLFSDYRLGIGEVAYWEFGIEYKQEIFVDESDHDITSPSYVDPDEDEDATIITLRTKLDTPFLGLRNRLKFSFANYDTDGKLKQKDQIKLSDDITAALGPFIFGIGVRVKQNDFKEPDPSYDDIAPSETLTSYVLNTTWAIFSSWLLVLEGLSESQSSNVAESEYDNTKITLSTLVIF